MKVGVSLPAEDVAFIDEYAARSGAKSRSAVLHQAITLLREADLEDAYTAAWQAEEADDDGIAWDAVSGDGIDDAAR